MPKPPSSNHGASTRETWRDRLKPWIEGSRMLIWLYFPGVYMIFHRSHSQSSSSWTQLSLPFNETNGTRPERYTMGQVALYQAIHHLNVASQLIEITRRRESRAPNLTNEWTISSVRHIRKALDIMTNQLNYSPEPLTGTVMTPSRTSATSSTDDGICIVHDYDIDIDGFCNKCGYYDA